MNTNSVLAPHGGCGLINRFIPEVERDHFIEKVFKHKVYTIGNADLATFYRIADGTLSPLEGPMNKDEFYKVLETETIERGGKKYAWTVPIAFAVSKEESQNFEAGETIAVKNEHGEIVGALEVSDIYSFDKSHYNKCVYATERLDHPGPRIVNDDSREYLLGGKIWAISKPRHPLYGKYMLSPEETRALFKERKWERIVAFQTRNPLHRAHEYTMVYAMEKLSKEGFFTGVVLNPLVGSTKGDDVPAQVRMRTYEALIKNRLIGYGDKDEGFWKKKGYDINDEIVLIGLDIKMLYAGPKEAIMHSIYRQNYGFTDLIIGRRHADAPFDDKTQVWADFDAQEKFNNLNVELLIKPLKVGFAAYYEELGRVVLVNDYEKKGYHQIKISGTKLRQKLHKGEEVDERIMRKSVAHILSEYYREKAVVPGKLVRARNIVWHDTRIRKKDREVANGHRATVIWFTGLPSSGKSTIAVELQSILFKRGCNVYILDGDNVRHGLNSDLGFSPQEREENIRRVGEMAKLFSDAGFLVLTSFISPYRKDRDRARALLPKGDFIEVFVKASVAACEERDTKGLYKKARKGEVGEFTGVSAPYEEPENPEIVVNTEKETEEESAQVIVQYLEENGYIPRIVT
ncbi:MAG: adenylyl-sulfate kinase [Candidatus Omnitrophota bacterium]|nr:MAG: adenylyl-sulfate kinase [Candidatus Omnitrophota bacterium]